MTATPTPAAPTAANARRPRDLRATLLSGGFLGRWQDVNTVATIPHCIARLEDSGVMDNFRRLAGRGSAPYRGPMFADSDLYKTLEALGWEAVRGVRDHEAFVDEAVALIRAVQEPDGYVNTYYRGPCAGERFSDLAQGHELYTLGHLVQAAIAWSHAGRTDLLDIALHNVELVHRVFGPGGRDDICGHPEIETALVELARVTGDARHRRLAARMVELRGHRTIDEDGWGGAYYVDHAPVKAAREVTGHAVRQLYLLAGVADLQLDDPEAGYGEALLRLWDNTHHEKLYLTGGLGSRHRSEAFGDPYELPADRAYSETCAAIANLHWNWRMLLLHGDARYADEIERGMYNAIAVSTALDSRSFFYSNPLQLRTGHTHEEDAPSTRLDWYKCACCPPNLARLLASITAYVTTETDDAVQVHLYAAGSIEIGDGVKAHVSTGYPWDGDITIELDAPAPRAIELRIPGWADGAELTVDGAPVPARAGSYATVVAGSRLARLRLPNTPTFMAAHPRVDAARGTLTVRRGPVVYCLEAADLPEGTVLEDVRLADDTRVRDGDWDDELLARRVTLTGLRLEQPGRQLYAPPDEPRTRTHGLGDVDLIPYCRWANRSPGAMRVRLPQR